MLIGIVFVVFASYFIIQAAIFGPNEHITKLFNQIDQAAIQGDWEEAKEKVDKLHKDWNKYEYFIMLNYAEEDFSIFHEIIAGLEGAVKTKDVSLTVNYAMQGKNLWKNFTKIVPQP
jgi:hypothetical protein